MTPPWWRSAVMYQVYPRSYADSNGDGVGDLPGLTARLDHIAALGVDGIWVTPFQRSPQIDNGYDVSDYCDVDPLFGTLSDLDALIHAAHGLGLKVLADLVPNHCSSEHPLFRQAVAAGPGSPERGLFHFREGKAADLPPNNWQSVFGGPAWSRIAPDSDTDREWYLHLFSPAQPDWNWDDPRVADLFDDVLRFWFDRGIDGLRVDVAHALYKAPGLPDAPEMQSVVDGLRTNPLACDQEPVHDVYRRWRGIAEEYAEPRILVGEVNLSPDRAARFARHDELNQTFAFAFAALGWDAQEWARVGAEIESARAHHSSCHTWALENHDIVRTVTRYGGGELGRTRAKGALLALLGFSGGVYLFQGQELGLPEVDVPEAARRDPMWARGGVCRDGARVPLPWRTQPSHAHGFSTADVEPWLPLPPGWGSYAVDHAAEDPHSVTTLIRTATQLRRELLASGTLDPDDLMTWHVTATGGLRIQRGPMTIVVAMGAVDEPLPPGTVLLRSDTRAGGAIAPGACAWVLASQ